MPACLAHETETEGEHMHMVHACDTYRGLHQVLQLGLVQRLVWCGVWRGCVCLSVSGPCKQAGEQGGGLRSPSRSWSWGPGRRAGGTPPPAQPQTDSTVSEGREDGRERVASSASGGAPGTRLLEHGLVDALERHGEVVLDLAHCVTCVRWAGHGSGQAQHALAHAGQSAKQHHLPCCSSTTRTVFGEHGL